MEYEHLLLAKENGIATITLNQPEKLNALSHQMKGSLTTVCRELAQDDEVRVVIVTGAGRGFCSGKDLQRAGAIDAVGDPQVSRMASLGVEDGLALDFPQLDKIVIAAVNGPCVASGLSLALSCDVRIASEVATFGAGFPRMGELPHAGMTWFLLNIAGIARAIELMCTSRIFTAAEAERLGIVSQVVPPDKLMPAARELARAIMQIPPVPVRLTKRVVWRSLLDGLSHQLDLETWGNQICGRTEDSKEAKRAFLEKRPPHFTGR